MIGLADLQVLVFPLKRTWLAGKLQLWRKIDARALSSLSAFNNVRLYTVRISQHTNTPNTGRQKARNHANPSLSPKAPSRPKAPRSANSSPTCTTSVRSRTPTTRRMGIGGQRGSSLCWRRRERRRGWSERRRGRRTRWMLRRRQTCLLVRFSTMSLTMMMCSRAGRYVHRSTPVCYAPKALLRYHRSRGISFVPHPNSPNSHMQAPYTDPATNIRYHNKSIYELIKTLVRYSIPASALSILIHVQTPDQEKAYLIARGVNPVVK